MEYINATWMNSTVWTIPSWCVFNMSIRTNNDVEGWHRRLNQRLATNDVPFYILVHLLHEEARLVPLQAKMVSEGKLKRDQRGRYRQLQGQLFELWEDYRKGKIKASRLLKKAARLAGVGLPS